MHYVEEISDGRENKNYDKQKPIKEKVILQY